MGSSVVAGQPLTKESMIGPTPEQRRLSKLVCQRLSRHVPLDDYDFIEARYLWELADVHRIRVNWWCGGVISRSKFVVFNEETDDLTIR